MHRLLAACEADERVRWLVVGSSVGRGAADHLSDLDMALGVRDPDFDAALPAVRAVVDRLGRLVDSYHHLLPDVTGRHERVFAQYADRCQLDLVVFPASTDIGAGPSSVVLYDPDGRIVVSSERSRPTPGQVREWAFRGWCELADVGKYLRRGSAWEALEQLHAARTSFWRVWAVAYGVPAARYGIKSILDFAPDQIPAEMSATVAGLDLPRLTLAAQKLAILLSGIGAHLPAEYRAALPEAMATYVTADLRSVATDASGPA